MNMKKIKLWKWQCLLMLALAFAMLLMPAAALADEESATTQQPLLQWSDDLSKAKYFLNNYAYFDLDAQVLQAADVPSMIKALQKTDPWAYYFTAEEFKLFVTEIEGDFVGIGVYITTEDGSLFVQGVIANSPAEKAGLKYGDIIVGVDKLSAPQATADELAEALGGEENTLVTIKYKRDGKVIEEVMSRKSIMIPSMEYWLMDDIVGYIQIEQFTSHTGEELAAAVQSLKKQGMKALLIDMRDCPGGELEGAVEACEVLAGDGPMVFFANKAGLYSFVPVEDTQPLGVPLAVLVNGETASAAELVAANVQDSGAGILIGVPTFGKGAMQNLIDLPSGAGIKFTTGKFITHAYQDIDAAGGVMPDIYIAEEEAQRNKALSWLKEQAAKASMLKFYVGLAGYSLGGAWQAAAVEALLEDGTSYVPMELTLAQLGWSREERDGIVYFSRGTHRLIADKAGLSLIMGSGAHKLVSRGETLYMPAAALRQYGYTVTWDGAERSVRIER